MAVQDEKVQTLSRLGLTFCQARVYLSLVQLGMSSVRTISQVSKVTREDIYRIMPQLQKLGLVEKAVTAPAKFRAMPIPDALSILLQRRTEETSDLQARVEKILREPKNSNSKATLHEADYQFILIPNKKADIQRRKKAIENAQKRIDIINSWKRHKMGIFAYTEVINQAMNRGVKVRAITEKPLDENSLPEIIQDLHQNPLYKIRYILTPPKAVVAIYDKKEVFVTVSAAAGLGETPSLWSNNPSLVAVMQDYFEIMWITSQEEGAPTASDFELSS